MTNIRLQRIHLQHFKGIRELTITPTGEDLAIYGSNATGKTTIVDAFMWLLVGRDSLNQASFEIKTLTPTGEALHNLEHAVEAILTIDGEELTLRKVYKEVWTKKRGSATSEWTGHTTDHYLDGVPVQQKEYQAKVGEIIDDTTLRLLTDPTYFNAVMKWQDRRSLLLEVCGDVMDADVIASNEDLKALPEILGKRSLDEHRKIVHAKRREINDELQKLPVRIDEAARSMPEAPGESADALAGSLEEARAYRGEREQEKARIQAGGQAAEAQAKVREIEGRLHDAMRAVTARVDGQVDDLREQRRAIAAKHDEASDGLAALTRNHREAQEAAKRARARADELRAEWKTVQASQPDIHTADTCPVCKQALPAEQVEQAHAEAVAQFNDRKSRKLTEIQTEGKAKAEEADRLDRKAADLAAGIEEAQAEAKALQSKLDEVDANIQSLSSQKPDAGQDEAVRALESEKAEAERILANLRQESTGALDEINAKIAEADESIQALQAKLAAHQQREKGEQRIDELTAQEKELAQEFERLEHELYLCDEFTIAKVGLLEDKINSRFELVDFKLFDRQVNGGVNEGCVATRDGVPYESMNGASRVQVGLDVIRTLQAHYLVWAPVWVDNRESVVELPDMDCQLISLVVSGQDKQLRVEAQKAAVAA